MNVKNVFVIDDDEFFLDTLKKKLTEIGDFKIHSFTSVERAIGNLKTTKPEIIFLDHILNGVNGIDAIPLFKEINPNSEIVIVTGYPKPQLMNIAMTGGALKYLQKNSLLLLNIREIMNEISPEDSIYASFWKSFINSYKMPVSKI